MINQKYMFGHPNVEREDTQEDQECAELSCAGCFNRLCIWWMSMKEKPVNPFTLRIRDKELREKFWKIELLQVKKRFELCSIIYIVMMTIGSIADMNDPEALAELWNISGDTIAILIIFSIIGFKWPYVHHYSLVALCVARAAWALI